MKPLLQGCGMRASPPGNCRANARPLLHTTALPGRRALAGRAASPAESLGMIEVLKELEALREENQRLKEMNARLIKEKAIAFEAPAATTAGPAIAPPVIEPKRSSGPSTSPSGSESPLARGIHWPTPNEPNFWDRPARHEPFPLKLEDSLQMNIEKDSIPLHIVHISAELAPIGKVGGLGDVVSGLSKACIARGHQVSVIMPFYESLDNDQIEGLKHELDFEVPKGFIWDGEMRVCMLRTTMFSGKVCGVPVQLIRPADWNACPLFRGSKIYGGSYDDREAYLYMCRAALELLQITGQQPHIIQVHDWHAAATSMLYWEVYNKGGSLWRPRMVMTIHNLDNSGECRQDEFGYTGIPGEPYAHVDKALDERTIGHNPERLNLMKGGVIFSNAVVTVSPSYARDIVFAGAGGFLREVFNLPHVSSKFYGILNGVDVADWNPAGDPVLPANFNATSLEGKALCKEYLQRGLGMAVDPTKPLVAVVSRLEGQKNPGLMHAAAYHCQDVGAQYVLLGSGSQAGPLRQAADTDFKNHPHIRILIQYSERLSHLIYAAADMVLVPSNFEPCGLTQLAAMRYGAILVVDFFAEATCGHVLWSHPDYKLTDDGYCAQYFCCSNLRPCATEPSWL
ncbi:soluble starch synthase [Dunaliella salina]|uniref:Starch synthase, chloroplastic/amyloplastic n=1 Tax=Dunaliella salina TaxID=3046 RepID=A0ABQ7GKG8_DUNSA|nr:soluble starch synthase [Dunaliella salina]|eukprot:KAF5835110.1 soluble starch synthase [Dunaliella salina]